MSLELLGCTVDKHTVVKLKLSLPIPHDCHSHEPIPWKVSVFVSSEVQNYTADFRVSYLNHLVWTCLISGGLQRNTQEQSNCQLLSSSTLIYT